MAHGCLAKSQLSTRWFIAFILTGVPNYYRSPGLRLRGGVTFALAVTHRVRICEYDWYVALLGSLRRLLAMIEFLLTRKGDDCAVFGLSAMHLDGAH